MLRKRVRARVAFLLLPLAWGLLPLQVARCVLPIGTSVPSDLPANGRLDHAIRKFRL